MNAAARCALVTGASSGIGRACARLLAARGYRVALLARRAGRLAQLEGELAGGKDAGHLVLPTDLRDAAAIASAFATVEREFGRLDLLVNNAGMGYRARVQDLEPELLRQLFETNVHGLLLSCRHAHALLCRSSRPVVVNVSSVVGRRGVPTMAAYAASKAAVCSIGEALRLEWGPLGIRVCTLNPGVTATEIFERQPNPARLHDPELADADAPERVAEEILALDQAPRAERYLRWKWRWLGALSVIAPALADRLLGSRSWIPPPARP